MTWLAWLAVLGPIAGGSLGLAAGFFMGKASNADELGTMQERVRELHRQVNALEAQARALAAAPPTRRESGRVLDLVTPGAGR